ncbi:hypothetical protein RP20_CCG005911 [Aedes albopictus]|nr:hypothetical protein RP20_CCG005911 [Aedes albopictus]
MKSQAPLCHALHGPNPSSGAEPSANQHNFQASSYLASSVVGCSVDRKNYSPINNRARPSAIVIVPVISLLNRRQTHHYQTFPPLDTTYWLVGTLEARMMKSEILIVCHPDRVALLNRLSSFLKAQIKPDNDDVAFHVPHETRTNRDFQQVSSPSTSSSAEKESMHVTFAHEFTFYNSSKRTLTNTSPVVFLELEYFDPLPLFSTLG